MDTARNEWVQAKKLASKDIKLTHDNYFQWRVIVLSIVHDFPSMPVCWLPADPCNARLPTQSTRLLKSKTISDGHDSFRGAHSAFNVVVSKVASEARDADHNTDGNGGNDRGKSRRSSHPLPLPRSTPINVLSSLVRIFTIFEVSAAKGIAPVGTRT